MQVKIVPRRSVHRGNSRFRGFACVHVCFRLVAKPLSIMHFVCIAKTHSTLSRVFCCSQSSLCRYLKNGTPVVRSTSDLRPSGVPPRFGSQTSSTTQQNKEQLGTSNAEPAMPKVFVGLMYQAKSTRTGAATDTEKTRTQHPHQ